MNSEAADHIETEAIVATGLTKWFGEGETRKVAVNGVTLVAHFGEMLFIVGPFGSGKTTMLSMISGILRPNAGTGKVKGANPRPPKRPWGVNPIHFAAPKRYNFCD